MSGLIAKADVFVQNLAPGALKRLDLDAESLRRTHPRLIACDVSTYGADGPYAARKGYDLLVQAESGLASVTGTPEAPGRVGVSACDIAAGLYAYQAILEALIARTRSGEGQHIQVSLFDALADWMTVPLLQAEASGENPARVGLAHVSIAPYGAYDCADGHQVLIAVQNPREWERLCGRVLGRPDLTADPSFADNTARGAEPRGARRHFAAGAGGLQPRRAGGDPPGGPTSPLARVNSVLDLSTHPHLRRIAVATPHGPVRLPCPPAVRPGATPALGSVPALGQHSDAIRAEFAPA